MENRLYVGNLAGDVSANELQDLFGQYGFVMDVKLARDRGTGRPLGFGFVTMATDEAGRAAQRALDGASLRGGVLKVDVARPDPADGSGRPGDEL